MGSARESLRLRTLLIALAVVIFYHGNEMTAKADQDCPADPPCVCETDSNQLIVNCRRAYLVQIPTFRPTSSIITELTFAGNNITSIPSGAFVGLRIVRLDLTENSVAFVAPDAFSGLQDELEELLMEFGATTQFPTAALSMLTNLRMLHIQGYRASGSLPSGTLASLVKLESLTLSGIFGTVIGSLDRLTAEDVVAQRTTLSYIDLSYNMFTTVPSGALSTLSNLTSIYLQANKISAIDSRVFASINSTTGVRYLDLSYNSISSLNKDAFNALAPTLWELSMAFCQLTDPLLEALRSLKVLKSLNIKNNQITSIDQLLDGMTDLQTLNVRMNKIGSLSRTTFRSVGASKSLRFLYLGSNPLVTISDSAFSRLVALEELDLDGARGLQLSAESFDAQQRTLRVLNLRGTLVGGGILVNSTDSTTVSPWFALRGLSALQTLSLAQCALVGAVPDFAFSESTALQVIDLSDNMINSLTPRSLAGLENSLEGISLTINQIQSLDQCLFNQFVKINILQVNLGMNPLQCDCRIKWLYNELKKYRNDVRYSAVSWTCAATATSDQRQFIKLTDNDFANCGTSSSDGAITTATPCENLKPSTRLPVTIGPDRPRAVIVRVNQTLLGGGQSTSNSLYVWWYISADVDISSLAVTCRPQDSSAADRYPITTIDHDGSFVVSGLASHTVYEVCLDVVTVSQGMFTECTTGGTSVVSSSSANMSLILGITIGAAAAVMLIVVIIVWCCVAASRRQKKRALEMKQLAESTVPKRSGQTKRFRKQKTSMTAADRTSDSCNPGGAGATAAITQAEIDRAFVNTVERLDPQSKDILASLLRTASAASLDRLGTSLASPSNYMYNRTATYNSQDSADDEVGVDRHVYEELPNDTYDTIPTDDNV